MFGWTVLLIWLISLGNSDILGKAGNKEWTLDNIER